MLSELSVYGLGFIAGVLSTLSPCVLPLLPILAGSALSAHRFGPWCLASGLALSFTLVGMLLATLGSVIGLDAGLLRTLAASLLILLGWVMLSENMQRLFTALTAGFSRAGQPLLEKIAADTLTGQLLLGLVLGIVWSPCVGPTLGATITLASQGNSLAHAAIIMALFGIGAATPLILLGSLSQQAMLRYKAKLSMTGKNGKLLLGALLIAVGMLILTGLDKSFEASVLNHSPAWLIRLSISV
jgi:cytochrome c biogenesis protein CcdA